MDGKLHVFTKKKSSCCGERQMLVLSRANGFVTKNCCKCGEPRFVGLEELPELPCEECGASMTAGVLRKNYHYKCTCCSCSFTIGTRVPCWQEKFTYHGIATPEPISFQLSK